MAGKAGDWVLDNGLAGLKSNATHIYICSQAPTTYTEATSTYALGNKNFGAGSVFPGSIAAGSPNGRKLTTAAVTDGSVTGNGTAARWAIVDSVNSRLLLDNDLSSSQVVASGNIFSLPGFDFRIPGA